jgi:hypothetical protein
MKSIGGQGDGKHRLYPHIASRARLTQEGWGGACHRPGVKDIEEIWKYLNRPRIIIIPTP